ncbi:MAG: hypothetical protein R2809_08195 [Flavobacteriales bacterium]
MPERTSSINQEFNTPLGVVRCGFDCDGQVQLMERRKYENGISKVYKTEAHQIEIVSFKINFASYNGAALTDSSGWIFKIEKNSDLEESIEVYCLLDKVNDEVEFDYAGGEHLDAIKGENDEWTLHIGTEDGDALHSRAQNDDWFPRRIQNMVDNYKSITQVKQNGFVTKIPHLKQGEKIHVQYLTAYDKRDDQRVNTWLAVEQSKKMLEKWIGMD